MSATALSRQANRQELAGFDPEQFRPRRLARIDQGVEEPHRGSIQEALLRAELQPLSKDLTILVDHQVSAAFQVARDSRVCLRPESLPTAAAAVLLRHAFEIAIIAPMTDGFDDPARLAGLWLATRTAGLYLAGMRDEERTLAQAHLAEGLERCYRLLAQPSETLPQRPSDDDRSALASLAGLLEDAPQDPTTETQGTAWTLFRSASPFAAPVEQLLVSGGDPRIRIEPEVGVNGYGSSPQPRPEVLSFSSSTASTISPQSFAAVELLRQSLLEHALHDELPAILGAESARLRQEILSACGLRDRQGVEAILTASGTDAEYHALALAGGGALGQGNLLNIVVAPDETGSGVPLAAAGCHFASETALGREVAKGEALAGFDTSLIQTAPLAVRRPDGTPRSLAEIDQELERIVALAAVARMKVLVHSMDSSKTGLGAPSLQALVRLRERYPETLEVVVDACQMRLSGQALAAYLALSFMVMVTGSKFLTGPAFAGALLVPPRLVAKAERLGQPPEGLGDYCSRADFSSTWPQIPPAAPACAAAGPLLRWRAALWEQRAFEAVPRALQDDCLARLGEAARKAIEESPWLGAIESPVLDRRRLAPVGSWHDRQSIFPFVVLRGSSSGSPLTMAEARQLHGWLLDDRSGPPSAPCAGPAAPSEEERAILAKPCHLGQPVKVPQAGQPDCGALRLCLSARLVSRVALDPLYAATLEARFARAEREIGIAVKKVELLAERLDRILGPREALVS